MRHNAIPLSIWTTPRLNRDEAWARKSVRSKMRSHEVHIKQMEHISAFLNRISEPSPPPKELPSRVM